MAAQDGRGEATSARVADLALAAGLPLADERCELLAPQLAWLLSELARLETVDLAGVEPLPVQLPAGGGANA